MPVLSLSKGRSGGRGVGAGAWGGDGSGGGDEGGGEGGACRSIACAPLTLQQGARPYMLLTNVNSITTSRSADG